MDFPGKQLQSDSCMLRVRYAKNTAVLTFKGPPKENVLFKSREEIETGLEDGENAVKILERLGLHVWFRYQKYRREYGLDDILIAIDETPIGNYVELEGNSSGILDLAQKLHIGKSRFMRHSYYDLYLEECRLHGIQPEDMVF
jgi:adenylate cyclase class 2